MADDFDNQEQETDLLGDPVELAHDAWGRPAFQVTEENQRIVQVLASAGWSATRIARHLGCDPKTLRKHFSQELEVAADAAEAEALLAIYGKMREGNVSAARAVRDWSQKGRAAPPQPKRPDAAEGAELEDKAGKPAQPAKPEPEGKKARLARDAGKPVGAWGDILGQGRAN